MSHRLQILFAPAEGALIRMLGLIERRGYSLEALTMEARAADASLVVHVVPRDRERHADLLVRQLARLVDVLSVSIQPSREASQA